MSFRSEATNPGDAVSVGTSTTQVAAANPGRQTLILCNDHATAVVYLEFGTSAAVANQGARLGPGMGIVVDDYLGAVQAISTVAATPVTRVEY